MSLYVYALTLSHAAAPHVDHGQGHGREHLVLHREARHEARQPQGDQAEQRRDSVPGGQGHDHRIELTWWKDKKDYAEGDQLDHIAFGVKDLQAAIETMRREAVEIAKEPYSLGSSRIAFIKDPNGIWLELIET